MLAIWSGDIPNGTVWTNTEVQQIIGDARVPAGATLTIQPGTMVKFNEFAGIDLLVEGRLLARGTSAQPIVFTSFRDDTGLDGVLGNGDDQDSNANGPSNGNNGDWNAVQFLLGGTGSVLDRVQVRYGGSGALAALVASVPMALTNSLVRNSATSGVRLQTSNSTLTTNTFQNNSIAAISMDLASNPAISGVTLTNNLTNALILDSGTLVGNGFWNDPDIVYRLTGDVTVPAGSTLIYRNSDSSVRAESGAVVTVINSTIDSNFRGVAADGATTTLTLTNNLITNQTGTGVFRSSAATVSTSFNTLFNPDRPNYDGLADQTGQRGNTALDPKYFNRANAQYQLRAGSPAIDSATNIGAPATDLLRQRAFR